MNLQIANIVLNPFTHDSRVLKESMSLAKAGYNVTVVALYEDGLQEREVVAGLAVHRIRLRTRKWSKNRFVQLFKYLEFLIKFCWQYRKIDIAHCNDLTALPAGVALKLLFRWRLRVVYDAHEYETEVKGISRVERQLRKVVESILIRFAAAVISVSDSIANEYKRLYKIPKPALVLNCPPYEDAPKHDIFRETFGIPKDKTIFLYQGGFSPGRGIEIILDAFKEHQGNGVLVLMGYGPLAPLVIDAANQSDKIYYHDAVAPDVLLCYTASADYGILFYENSCLNHYYCSPNKIFEYLMAGLPVISANLFEMKRLVENNNIGVVAAENTGSGFAEAVELVQQRDYQELVNNVHSASKHYCWENQEKVLLELYQQWHPTH